MMGIGDIRAAVTVIRSIREDWDYRAIEQAISDLAAGDYDHPDILAACITIARNQDNRAPITLKLKAPDVINQARGGDRTPRRSYRPGRTDTRYVCDYCLKPESHCQLTAANTGELRDHDYISVADADRERAKARTGQRRTLPVPDLFKMPD